MVIHSKIKSQIKFSYCPAHRQSLSLSYRNSKQTFQCESKPAGCGNLVSRDKKDHRKDYCTPFPRQSSRTGQIIITITFPSFPKQIIISNCSLIVCMLRCVNYISLFVLFCRLFNKIIHHVPRFYCQAKSILTYLLVCSF